jgi:DNA mismatch repair ATPase MutS
MTSGRLDDELRRMSVIADQIGPHCLVLFNESFAGTNEREGSEIGYQVARALLDAQVRVFFVTHRFEFAERFRQEHPRSARFLRAERQPDGRRTYRLAVREPLPTSFGEDLYYQLVLPARRLAGRGFTAWHRWRSQPAVSWPATGRRGHRAPTPWRRP